MLYAEILRSANQSTSAVNVVDEPAAALEDLRVSLDPGGAIDNVEDCVDAVRVGLSQCVDSVYGVDVVDVLGTQSVRFAGGDVSAHGRDDTRSASHSHLNRVTSDSAGCPHHH